jgi:transposase
MAAAIGVRGDYDTARLRELAKRSEDANQTRRLLALAAIYDGGSRTEAAKIGGVGLQTVRDWVLAFNAEGPPGLVNGKAPGNAPLLTQAHRQALLEIVESGSDPGGSWRGALAADRPRTMGVRGIPHFDQQADPEPRIARA